MAETRVRNEEKKEDFIVHGAEDELHNTESMKQTVVDAKRASDNEQSMTLMEGIRLYPKAVGWSVLISTCIAMEGYDVTLTNNFYAFDTFNRVSRLKLDLILYLMALYKYSVQFADGTYQVPASWQAGLSNGVNIGEMIGLLLNG